MNGPIPSPPAPLDDRQLKLMIGAIASVLFIASLGQTVVTTALPTILSELGGLAQITWVITAYLMAATVGAPICGKLGDLFGRKQVMQGGIAVFLLGSLICALAPNLWALVAGRFVQGIGGGGLIVVSMATVADMVPARERGRYQGLLGGVFAASTVVGPLAGGFIVQHFAWEWLFLLNLPLGLAAFVVLSCSLTSVPTGQRPAIDYAGGLSLSLLLSLAVISASLGGSVLAWNSAEMLGLLLATAVALLAFAVIETRAAEPILPLGLFRINTFLVSNAVGLIVGSAMFGTIVFVPFFMQVVKGMSPALSGMFTFPMMIGIILGSTISGRIMVRTGRYRRMPTVSTLVLAVAMASFAQMTTQTADWWIAVSMVLTGLGIGPVMAVGVTAIQNAVPVSMVGVGTASANMFRMIGGSVGTAVFGAVFAAGLTRELGGALGGVNPRSLSKDAIAAMPPELREMVVSGIAQALHPLFWAAAVMACLACFISLFLTEIPLEDRLAPRGADAAE